MLVRQLSVFVENRSGRLAAATTALADHGVNIVALSLADTADFGILRLIVSDAETARGALKEAGFTVVMNDVLAVEVEDRPGGLASLLSALDEGGINVEYMYAFSSLKVRRAALIFRFEDPQAAIQCLGDAGFSVMGKVDVLGE